MMKRSIISGLLLVGIVVVVGWGGAILFAGRPQTGPVAGDVNMDGKVDCTDVNIVRAAMGKRNGEPGYSVVSSSGIVFVPDINRDGVVDEKDLDIVIDHLPNGMLCP